MFGSPPSTHAGSSNTDALFERELKKYEPIQADVARNVSRNEELLAAVSRDAQVGVDICRVFSMRGEERGVRGGKEEGW
jgi:hypothetical protein